MPGSDTDDSSIPLLRREVERIEPGRSVKVRYRPNRGAKTPKEHGGEILNVEPLGADRYRFWFYDADANRKIEVTLEETVAESAVRSMKSTTFTTIGDVVRVLISETEDGLDGLKQEFLLGKRVDDYDTVIAVAAIKENQRIIESMR